MKKFLTRDEWAKLILLLAILFGIFLRFNPTLLAGFAVNDGGMFAVMVDDLRANRYLLPAFTSYNHSNIPFAYPPLGLYFGALVADIFGMRSFDVVRWIPALFASLSIPAFYSLSLRLLKDKYHASLSTLFFALVPRAFFWMVMGGGLTRAPGQFFMLLALGSIVRLYEENQPRDVLLAGLFAGLAVVSHPEAAVHTALSVALIWLVLSRTRVAFVRSVVVGIIVLLITSPWWVTVISNHGVTPLISAAQTGENSLAVFHLVFFTFTQEPFMTVIAVLGMIGIIDRLVRREYLLPVWMLLPFLAAGRSATNLVIIPLTMLSAHGLANVILPALQASVKGNAVDSSQVSNVERGTLVYLMLYMVFSAYQFGFQLSSASLQGPQREAMEWVLQNTSQDSRFLVLSGATSAACDATSEWFPALTGRKSLYTVQGTEWTLGNGFPSFLRAAVGLQECSHYSPSCIERSIPTSYQDYVYLSKYLYAENCESLPLTQSFLFFAEEVREGGRFEVVYETDEVLIYKGR